MAAAGALTIVPLGHGVEVHIPRDLISTAESVWQKRDPDFEFIEQPVEIKIEGLREQYGRTDTRKRRNPAADTFISFRYRGYRRLQNYHSTRVFQCPRWD